MKLSIVTVASGEYLEYWIDLAESVYRYSGNDINLDYHIFTDRVNDAIEFANTINLNIVVHNIDSQNWLSGTLMRYKHYRKYFNQITGDVILHLDADMLVVDNFAEDLFNILTNNSNRINLNILVHKIDSQNWLSGTLMRYKNYRKYFNLITGDVILHLDADMLVVDNFIDDLFNIVTNNSDIINLVYHPGYWRKNKFYVPYLFNHKMYAREIINLWKSMLGKSPGSWETRSDSSAYTPEDLQNAYFCGAVWFGKREIVYKFITEVDELIIEDQKNGIIAVWQDESYLNKWAAHNIHSGISPKYCFLLGKAHLSMVKPLIVAVVKEENR